MKKLTIIAIFFFFSLKSLACEQCILLESFCKILYSIHWQCQYIPEVAENYIVVKAKILNHQYHGVQIKVLDVILGNETRDTLMIWGGVPGLEYDLMAECRNDIGSLGFTDTMILCLKTNIEVLDTSIESSTDYIMTDCGVDYLLYYDGIVQGRITQGLYWESMPYEEFKLMVPECYAPTGINESILPSDLAYPNPFSQQLYVPNSQSVRIFNVLGSLVYSGTSTPNQPIDLHYLPSGIYYIEATQKGKQTPQMQKVLKM